MKIPHLFFSFALLLSTSALAADSTAWTIDPAHTQIGFTARHLGFAKVHGEFKSFSAKVAADPKTGKITALEAEADAKSVNTDVQKRDDHLRSDDFFNAEKYPKLKLVLKSIEWRGNAFTATCALTIRDKTKDVKLEGELLGFQTVNFGKGPQLRAAYEAEGKINRKDFGLNFAGLAEGIAIVSDEVELNLEVSISAPATAPVKS
jgi:polyisoprenoid-binding protein YceI